jgi:hypothetical protein
MRQTSRDADEIPLVRSLAWFTVHQFIGTYGIVFAVPWVMAFASDLPRLFGKSYPMAGIYWILTGTPYFPVQIAFGILLGFLIGRHFRHSVMRWVWVIPLAVLSYAVIAVPTFLPGFTPPDFQAGVGQSRLAHYFGWGCQPSNQCLDQVYVTLPFYVSLSYALGALLVQKVPERFRRPNPRNFWAYLIVGILFVIALLIESRDIVNAIRQTGNWSYLRVPAIAAGAGVFLILYAVLVRRGSSPVNVRNLTKS